MIGFHGGVKLIDKVPHPAFTLHVNGCDKQGLERMGTQLGVILQSKIPAFLLDLAQAAADADMILYLGLTATKMTSMQLQKNILFNPCFDSLCKSTPPV